MLDQVPSPVPEVVLVAVLRVVKAVFTLVPMPVITAMTPVTISAAMMAHSTVSIPASSCTNLLRRFIEPLLSVRLIHGCEYLPPTYAPEQYATPGQSSTRLNNPCRA